MGYHHKAGKIRHTKIAARAAKQGKYTLILSISIAFLKKILVHKNTVGNPLSFGDEFVTLLRALSGQAHTFPITYVEGRPQLT